MRRKIFIVSDIHYACPAEQARRHHELRAVRNPFVRLALKLYRDYIWLRDPYGKNHLLDQFLNESESADYVIANGDYSCNTAFIGVSDNAACQSAKEALGKLRGKFGRNFQATFGDHELGKLSLVGNQGGLRLASWHSAINELSLQPFWKTELGHYVFIGVTSTLIAFPVFQPESLTEERGQWEQLREEHFRQIRQAFNELRPNQKVILFSHDPTALPFLWREREVQSRLSQVEHTIIGHLHSPLVFWKSRLLAGMPPIHFLGNSIRRFSMALREARHWREFKVKLCPSLAGIELLKDGGFLSMEIDLDGKIPARLKRHKIKR